ncbi:hypothetical protein HFU84_01825 [Acidithiobacillus sp. CV18-2]|nr:hypothetical protein [Acidithiobacillus sp. CV18-3]MBU2758602.1 hypothetical protein [Acidithiobacillus sp. BN09-2]MBU2776274.1 hypothetical protein [Acidithiobacillus sp. CV18-2]MBU2800573.1 hypothetical protein [Acidithiobacillus sp. VAN18-4]
MHMIEALHDSARGISTIDGESMVFHCNHYNRFLQMVVEDCHYIDFQDILICSAAEVSFRQLRHHFTAHQMTDRRERLEYAAEMYRNCGFGNLPLETLPESPKDTMDLSETASHYGRALQLNHGKRRVAGEYFDLGFAIGACSACYDEAFSGQLIGSSISLGNACTQIIMQRDDRYSYLFDLPTPADVPLPAGADQVAPRHLAPHIDEEGIIAAVASLPLSGNDEGLIPAFGVELTRHYADYYNLVSFRFERALQDAMATHRYLGEMLSYEYPTLFQYKKFAHLQGEALSRTLLIEAGHICGFNTMGGIMRSDPWYQLVVPMIKERSDWIHGIIACINALGWGVWRVQELLPNERLVLRAWYPYESLGYLRAFGSAQHGVDYLFRGIGSSLMNLLYEADITTKPDLTLEFYYQACRSKNGFWAKQTRCVAQGDPYSEIVVERGCIGQ